ncbi:MAG: peptide deformylase, partial [Acidobacteria bacterium]|nr:peptide deformylase [Acidobacteriota bacterium]
MIRPIAKYGDHVLHQHAETVTTVTGEIGDLIKDMIETMYAAPGVGLAAPQIGIPLRVFVVDVCGGRSRDGLMALINPEFVERDGMQL